MTASTSPKDEALKLALDALEDPSILNAINNAKFFIKQALAQPEQDACGWQFYAGGKWHTGMEVNDHRVNTEAAGIPTRNVYPGPVATGKPDLQVSPQPKPEQEPVASIYITPGGEREFDDWRHALPVGRNLLYTPQPQFKPQPEQPEQESMLPPGFRHALDEGLRQKADLLASVLRGSRVNYDVEQSAATLIWEMRDALVASTPPQRPWVGLTNNEVNNFAAGCHLGKSVQAAIYEAEAKLKEKNT